MKILFVIPSLRSGGKERRLLELLKSLRKFSTLEIELLLMSDEVSYAEFESLDIKTYYLERNFKKDLLYIFRFTKLVFKIKPDLIHSWAPITSFYSILSSKLLRVPLITNEISTSDLIKDYSRFRRLIQILNFKYADLIISNSKVGLINSNAPIDKSIAIHNGIHLNRFENLDDQYSEIGCPNKLNIVMVAAFRPNKRYDILLKVVQDLNKSFDNLQFFAVGHGETYSDIKNEANSLNIKNLIFTGMTKNVESLLSVSDIGLLITDGEGISNALMEYMASYLPIVVTDQSGGTPELFKFGNPGFNLPIDVESIVDSLTKLIESETLRYKMGNDGRRIIEENFTIEFMSNKFLETYNSILKNK